MIIIATTVMLMARSRNYPKCSDFGSIAPHVSLSNKLDRIRSGGSNLLGKNAIIIATTVKAYGKKSGHIEREHGCSLRI
jgi:hypothetical protein